MENKIDPKNIGVAVSGIDDDEWSWSVELRPDGKTAWGSDCKMLGDGCERSKGEAVACVRAILSQLGVDPKDVTTLPF